MPGPFPRTSSILLAIHILFSFSSYAQNYQFRNFGLEQGLPHRWVYTIDQDQDGYLWLGTGTELARFNGFEFESNPSGDSLPADFIFTSFKDSRGRIWFGYNDGSVTVLENNKITIAGKEGLGSRITAIAEDHLGNILAASQHNGLKVIDIDGNITIFRENFNSIAITAMAPAGEDELLIGTFEGLYSYKYSPGSEPERVGLVAGIPRVTIEVIANFGEKGVFVGTRDRGLYHLEKETGGGYKYARTGALTALAQGRIQSVFLDNRDNLWISTWGQGVFKIANYFTSDKPAEVRRISSENGLAADYVYGVFQDMEENYWFTTFDGLSLLVDEAFSFFPSFGEPFGKNVLAVHSDKDHIWLGGESGLLRMGKNNASDQTFFGTGRGLPFDRVTALVSDDEGNLWIGTGAQGIYKLSPGVQRAEPFHLSANSLENAINDFNFKDGILSAATSNGVFVFNLKTGGISRFSTNEGLPHNFIRSIFRDTQGNNWVATRGNRLVDISNNISISTGVELEFTAVTEDKTGNLWTATNGRGIISFTDDTLFNITASDGLHSDFCYSMITGQQGDIWVGHRLGLSRVTPGSYFVRTYGTESSITGDFNSSSVHKTSEGILLFGNTEGLVSFDISNENRSKSPPMLNITSLQISDLEHATHEKVSLPYGSYKVRIEFIGLNYANPAKVLYQYKLEGYDLDWSDLSPQRHAYYSRLDDGKFNFLVRAVSAEGV
jgi:ligand-binding sensor domain-containing protein